MVSSNDAWFKTKPQFFHVPTIYLLVGTRKSQMRKHATTAVNYIHQYLYFRFMLNGLALYTAWTILASLVNLVQAWNYVDPVCPEGNICPINHARKRMEVSSLTALSFLLVIHFIYFCIENIFFEKACRWGSVEFLKELTIFPQVHPDSLPSSDIRNSGHPWQGLLWFPTVYKQRHCPVVRFRSHHRIRLHLRLETDSDCSETM